MNISSPTDYYNQFLMMVQTILLAEKEQIRDKVHKAGISRRPGVRVELETLAGAMDVDPECLRRQREEVDDSIYVLAVSYVWWYLKIFTQPTNNQWEKYTKTDWMKERPKWIVTIQERKEQEKEAESKKKHSKLEKRASRSEW